MESIYSMIRKTFDESIEKRMLSDREIGCLLSGGLDVVLCFYFTKKM